MRITQGGLLGNRLRYRQPEDGYRTGIEPVLLAAAVPAAADEEVLEAGSGAGAGLLCLAARVPRLRGVALERDDALAALAAENLAANEFSLCRAVRAEVAEATALGAFHHVFANPPWHNPAGTASPVAARDTAKRAPAGLAASWTLALARALRPRGTITLVLPAASVPEWLAALAASACGAPSLLPLWPREGRPAKLVLLQARRGARGAFTLLPGLVLHDAAGFTPQAQAILTQGEGLGALFG
jgi:tRNA1Val (adenine37-N6)-methyltransferase